MRYHLQISRQAVGSRQLALPRGDGTEPNIPRALVALGQAAGLGDVTAWFYLGAAYETEKDLQEAARWYRKVLNDERAHHYMYHESATTCLQMLTQAGVN